MPGVKSSIGPASFASGLLADLWAPGRRSLREAAGVEEQGSRWDQDDPVGEEQAEALEVDEQGCGGGAEALAGGDDV